MKLATTGVTPRRAHVPWIASVIVAIGTTLTLVALTAAQLPEPKYRVFRPDSRGPHPAIVFVSGCDGFAPTLAPTVYERRAERLRAQGYVVVFVDYLGRRSLRTCAGPITHEEAARDVVAAAAWLGAQSDVDRARTAAMGWSYGGRAVLVALARSGGNPPGFSRAVVYYPDCRALEPWKTPTPVLMLLGGDDDMTPARLCQDAVTKVATPTAVKVVVYPGARHAFDVPDLPATMKLGFATIGYHAKATAAAQKEVEQFLRPGR
jgi:dienelactone hydrolase